MKPNKPVKRFVIGIRTKSKLNPSFNTLLIVCRESWDSKEEAEKWSSENPAWRTGVHKYACVLELTPNEIEFYNQV